jgi:hypothetical protein
MPLSLRFPPRLDPSMQNLLELPKKKKNRYRIFSGFSPTLVVQAVMGAFPDDVIHQVLCCPA